MAHILIVDDEKSIQEFFTILLEKEGMQVNCAASGEAAREKLKNNIFDLVITDLSMPGMSGLDLLKEVKAASPDTAVILVTAYGTTESAVQAMKEGASDYLLKPFKMDEVRLVINQTLKREALSRENELLKRTLRERFGYGKLIGNSAPMQKVFEMIDRLAQNRSNVLITGASGTGKELVARAIHDRGARKESPFVSVNCGAIPENLIESELFGHMKGAFTGAVSNKRGLMEVASGGTFFFDEVAELPLNTQVKLLRVLQEKKLRRVGATDDTLIDCRIIAATNKELEKEVAAGRFREDLYYRLNVFAIKLPALRERREDIPKLVEHFAVHFAKVHDRPFKGFTPAAMGCLTQYDYPGNIRELENLLEQTIALSKSEVIDKENLPPLIQLGETRTLKPSTAFNGEADLDRELGELERSLVTAALEAARGVKKEAAKRLKISFRSLRYRLQKFGLDSDGD